MNFLKIALPSALAIVLVGCGGGDININADDNSSIVDNSSVSGGELTATITCASYVDENGDGQAGVVDGDNCIYSESFADFDNPILTSITFSDIGDGAHIFAGSLFVGQNYDALADATTAGIAEGGDGPTLTIRAGVTIALQAPEDFVAVMRGSRVEAQGTSTAPITFTSESDLRGLVTPEQVQTWGGLIINGFGFTNACSYDAGWDRDDLSGTTLAVAAGQECSVLMEGAEGGRENHYGGAVHDDNSGTLSYVVVKHAGFEVVEGNELNGITFGAVGSGTSLNNIEIYSNQDDGIEFFGGSADLTNYVALYVRDDSIDIDQGYFGTIRNALVIQGGAMDEAVKTGAHCVESDGSASSLKATNIANDYVSKATIENLTCIISAKAPAVAGNSDPGAGINAEEAHNLTLSSSIITTAYTSDAALDASGVAIDASNLAFTNYCFQLEDSEDLANAGNGLININTSIFACADISSNKGRDADITLTAGTTYGAITGQAFLEAQDNIVFSASSDGTSPPNGDGSIPGRMTILDGFYSVPVADMLVDGNAVIFTTAGTAEIGAVSAANDWTLGWTYGLHEGSRGQALWFQ